MIDKIPFGLRKSLFTNYANVAVPVLKKLPIPPTAVFKGEGSIMKMARAFRDQGAKRPMIITDKDLFNIGLHEPVVAELEKFGMDVGIFGEVFPDPSFELIEKGIRACLAHEFDSIIAVGGGSSMDAAKIINVCAAHNKSPRKVVGVFKIRKRGKLFACVPTTAGTGSEVTIAAVVSDKENNTKKPCIDTCLVPEYAVLAPELMRKLPAPIVAATGIDALTHAVEAYIGNGGTHYTNQISIDAIDLIFTNLVKAYSEPDNMEAKSNMLEASHLAGLAFTRAGVGWVHAIAHQVGSYYHTPHGLANAIILPTILEFYLPVAGKKMADMARAAGLLKGDESEEEAAKAFLDGVKALNKTLNIPEKLEGLLDADIPAIAIAAQKEVYTTPYPVPLYFQSEDELEALILSLQG